MGAAQRQTLTKRQLDVLERIDRRVPIKVIAQELDVSETRINQHIRALKNFYQVDSLNELVEWYREEFGEESDEFRQDTAPPEVDLSKSVYRKKQLAGSANSHADQFWVDPGEIVLSDVMPLGGLVPWNKMDEPRIVPGVLNGDNAILFRLAAIVGIAFAIMAVVVLTVTAAVSLTEMMDGKEAFPEDYYQGA